MVSSPNDPNKIKNAKYLSWLYIIALVSIFLSGRIQFWMPDYSNMDFVKYKTMAEASPEISSDIIQPFAYRILAPWFAGLFPVQVEITFYILNIIALLLLVFLFYKFLIENNIEYRISFALTAAFIFNRYFFQFLAWDYFHLTDTLIICAIIIFLINLYRKNWFYIILISVIAVLIKETILIMLPVAFVYLYMTNTKLKEYLWITLVSIITFGIFISLRLFIITPGGESLWTQFSTGLVYFLTPESFVKKIVLAFIPFGFIPLFYYKNSYNFLRINSHYLLLLVIVFLLSFFGDAERLMMPFAPVYFVLIGYIIQQYITEQVDKSKLRKFLLHIMLLAFFSSFYHLWGIVKLPSSLFSLISALILSAITVYLFWNIERIHTKKPT